MESLTIDKKQVMYTELCMKLDARLHQPQEELASAGMRARRGEAAAAGGSLEGLQHEGPQGLGALPPARERAASDGQAGVGGDAREGIRAHHGIGGGAALRAPQNNPSGHAKQVLTAQV